MNTKKKAKINVLTLTKKCLIKAWESPVSSAQNQEQESPQLPETQKENRNPQVYLK